MKHSELAEELQENPGEWARIKEFGTTASAGAFASNVRNGKLRAFAPAGTYEATSRKTVVWARYVVNDSEEG